MAQIDKYGVEFSDDKKILMYCPKDFNGAYVIPNSVTELGIGSIIAEEADAESKDVTYLNNDSWGGHLKFLTGK